MTKILASLNFDLMITKGLPIMGIGMISIFIVIGVIILAVSLLSKVGRK